MMKADALGFQIGENFQCWHDLRNEAKRNGKLSAVRFHWGFQPMDLANSYVEGRDATSLPTASPLTSGDSLMQHGLESSGLTSQQHVGIQKKIVRPIKLSSLVVPPQLVRAHLLALETPQQNPQP